VLNKYRIERSVRNAQFRSNMRACLFAVIGGNVAHARRAAYRSQWPQIIPILMSVSPGGVSADLPVKRITHPYVQRRLLHSGISIAVFAINDVRLRADC